MRPGFLPAGQPSTWRERLRGMTIEKLVTRVAKEVPEDIMQATAVWVAERS